MFNWNEILNFQVGINVKRLTCLFEIQKEKKKNPYFLEIKSPGSLLESGLTSQLALLASRTL